ncbi:hypothetical protein SELMODRAFT_234474 [Selaginella moellendorffii]|uniref:Methyltransferase domain-containing protein n=1 Tax=Selaginella moellendorffii TaxID=88036 RepID=D8SLL2_SELML|nr:hypothetical protein SELMODRAFT_234474 [Selaginella moellendorffii]
MAHLREYDDIQYWDKRYLDEGDDTFDWYQRFKELKPLLCRYIKKDSRILMAGCGNAVLSEEMVLNGFKEIVNIDFSSVVIKKMQQRHGHIPQLTYVTMDVRNMAVFGDNSFDAVIDKGLMDSMLCGSNGFIDVRFMLEETRSSVFKQITYGEPLLRMHHLKHPAFDWKVVLHLTPKPGTTAYIPEAYAGAIPMNGNWECDFLLGISDPDINFVYVCTKPSS